MKIIGVFLLVVLFTACTKKNYQFAEGGIYGTVYHVSYQSDQDLSSEIRKQMERVNESLSMFNKKSLISRLNRNETDGTDTLFVRMFRVAQRINLETDGAFDITVAPLMDAWGFTKKHDSLPSPAQIDSIMLKIGMDKLMLKEGRFVKSVPGVEMDASAIAKGLGVDLVADYLDSMQVLNYMVEIGGEIRVKGFSDKGRPWRIGVDKPVDDPELNDRQIQLTLALTDGALATSGNYRNFYVRDGKKYGHTIDPKTGYTVQRDILSSSVYAPTCMEADAYATSFMVMGFKKSCELVEKTPGLDACFIYEDNGVLKVWMTSGFKKLVLPEK